MAAFRAYLAAIAVAIYLYTAVVIASHGPALLPVFFGDIAAMAWPDQFNLYFLFLLTLSALWVAWRHGFSTGGLGLACLAAMGGATFLSVYLLVGNFQVKGDVRALVLGRQ